MEDYWLYDLIVNYDFSDRATLFGGIDNLFDEKYRRPLLELDCIRGGRKATIGLRYSFELNGSSAFRAVPYSIISKPLTLNPLGTLAGGMFSLVSSKAKSFSQVRQAKWTLSCPSAHS